MARIRSIHPGVFTDEGFASLSMAARVLLFGVWTEADDHGVFEWKPLSLKMRIFPGDSIDVDPLLAELVAANVIAAFDLDGRPYGAIRNFCKFQRPKKPVYRFPLPADQVVYVGGSETKPETTPPLFQERSGTPPSTPSGSVLPPPSSGPSSVLGPQMEEGEKKEHGGDARARTHRPELIAEEASDLADEIAVIAGIDPEFWPPGWCGAAQRVQAWLAQGWQREIILIGARKAMARKRDGPPDGVTYFEKPIAREHALQQAPVPTATVVPFPQEVVHVAAQPTNGIHAARDRLLARLDDGACEVRGGASGADARLLPKN